MDEQIAFQITFVAFTAGALGGMMMSYVVIGLRILFNAFVNRCSCSRCTRIRGWVGL